MQVERRPRQSLEYRNRHLSPKSRKRKRTTTKTSSGRHRPLNFPTHYFQPPRYFDAKQQIHDLEDEIAEIKERKRISEAKSGKHRYRSRKSYDDRKSIDDHSSSLEESDSMTSDRRPSKNEGSAGKRHPLIKRDKHGRKTRPTKQKSRTPSPEPEYKSTRYYRSDSDDDQESQQDRYRTASFRHDRSHKRGRDQRRRSESPDDSRRRNKKSSRQRPGCEPYDSCASQDSGRTKPSPAEYQQSSPRRSPRQVAKATRNNAVTFTG